MIAIIKRTRIFHVPRARVFCCAASLLGCEADPPASEFIVDFSIESGERLCLGSQEHFDRFVTQAFEFLDESVPAGFQIPVQVTPDPPCEDSAFCYFDSSVYLSTLTGNPRSPGSIVRHELSHAVITPSWGHSIPFFEEGFAETISQGQGPYPPQASSVDIGVMLDKRPIDVDYRAAALFVRFLIDTRGLSRFKRLYQALGERSRAEIEAQFLAIYGEEFTSIEAEFSDGTFRCTFLTSYCDPSIAEPFTAPLSITIAASCLDPEFYGSTGSLDHGTVIATQKTYDIETGGSFRLTGDFSESLLAGGYLRQSSVQIIRCGDCTEQRIIPFMGGESSITLESGLYTFLFLPGGDSIMTFGIEPLPAP